MSVTISALLVVAAVHVPVPLPGAAGAPVRLPAPGYGHRIGNDGLPDTMDSGGGGNGAKSAAASAAGRVRDEGIPAATLPGRGRRVGNTSLLLAIRPQADLTHTCVKSVPLFPCLIPKG